MDTSPTPSSDADRRALASLLDMLNLQVYAPQLVAQPMKNAAAKQDEDWKQSNAEASTRFQGFHSIDELTNAPETWKKIITKRHHRDILEGYLAVRAAKNATTDHAAAERRFESYQTIKGVLKDLRELQLEKARLDQEQHKLLVGDKKKPVSKEEVAAAQQRLEDEIIDIITKIDSAKERLEMAQELIGFSTNAKGPAAAPSRQKTRRFSASSGASSQRPPLAREKPTFSGSAMADDVKRPMKAAPPAPPTAADHQADDGAARACGASTASTASWKEGSSSTTQEDAGEKAHTVRRGDQHTHVKTGTSTWSHVNFTSAKREDPTTLKGTAAAPPRDAFLNDSWAYGEDDERGVSHANDIGHGWDRNFPTTRAALMERVRIKAELQRKAYMKYAEKVREEQLDADIAAAMQSVKDKIAVPFRGNGPLLSKPPPAVLEDLRPKSAGRPQATATFRPKTASTTRRGEPQQKDRDEGGLTTSVVPLVRKAEMAKEKYEREKAIQICGVRADTVTLGMDLPNAHGAQMKCGALLRATVEAARRNAEQASRR